MKKLTLLILALSCLTLNSYAQNKAPQTVFSVDNEGLSFIENKGQFDNRNWSNNTIHFGMDNNPFYIFLNENGVSYRLDKIIKNPEHSEEEEREGEDSSIPKRLNISEIINITWVGANKNFEIVKEEKTSHYYSYAFRAGSGKNTKNINHLNGYEKVTYKNIYDNIDIEFTIDTKGGMKYSLILHPGANLDDVKFKYSKKHTNTKNENIEIGLKNQNLEIATSLGTITEHAPITYYEDDGAIIPSRYKFEDQILTFELDSFDNTRKVVIDPWVVSPTFNTSSAVWEVETDAAGNVYTIGGETPMELRKYDAGGNLQWAYVTPWDTNSVWLGTLATDDAGNSFVTSGTSPEIERIDNTGNMVFHNNGSGLNTEYWTITFNCDKTKLIVGGTGGALLSFEAKIYNININNGNVINSVTVGTQGGGLTPVEVRSISSSKNAKYIYLTHNEVGAISENIGACPTDDPYFEVDNGHNLAYKCENYLPATQNGGGLKALIANDNFIYTHSGDEIHQRDLNTGALINTVSIPGGNANNGFGGYVVHNSGLDVDECGNVYAGSDNGVAMFDANLNLLNQQNTGFSVYDVSVNSNGEVLAVGAQQDNGSTNRNGRIESVNFGACAQFALVCCDANICIPDTLCETDPPYNLIVSTPGGTFSGTGITDPANGVFDPSVSGPGTFTITYTLPCGFDEVEIVVSTCANLDACVESNGDITVTSGAGPYEWQEQVVNQDCSACFFGCNLPAGCAVNVTSWSTFTTGTTITPPGTYPIRVIDATGSELIINDPNNLPACSTSCDATIDPEGPFCETDPAINMTAAQTGGTWSGNGITDPNNGTFDPSDSGPGTHTITYTLPCGDTDTEDITVNATDDASFDYNGTSSFCISEADPAANITGLAGGTFSINNGGTINAADGTIDLSATGTGTYDVTYTTNGSCPNSSVVTIDIIDDPVFNINFTDPSACGLNDGSITLTGLSPNTSYDISYDDDGTTQGPTSLSSNGSGEIIISGLDAGNYTNFIVENSNGCSTTDNGPITLSDPSSPTVGAGADQTICDGDAITLTANNPDNASISWDNGVNDGVSFTPGATTTYTVTADLNGCVATDQVTITVNPSFNFVVNINDPSACGVSDGSIVLSGLNANTNYDVSYDTGGSTVGPTGYTSDGTGSITIPNLGAGSYNNIVITPASGCSATDNTGWVLTDPNAPTIGAGADQTICNGDAVTLTANNPDGAVIAWDNGITDGIAFNPSTTTTYTVTADLAGCTASDQVTVTVNPLPNPIISNVNDLCVNDAAVVLNSNLAGGIYSGTGVSGNQFDPAIAGVGTHTITYDYTDVNGCSNTTTIDINVVNIPAFNLVGNDPSGCATNDGSIVLENLSPNAAYDVTYNDNGSIVGPTNMMSDANGDITISGLGSGNYTDFTVTLASGCSSTDNTVINLTAPNAPTVDAGPDISICTGESVTLTANNPSGAQIVWDNNVTDGVAFSPNQTTTYTVTADPNGCPATDQVTVTVNPIPNVTANASATTICSGDQVTLFGSGVANLQWDNGVTDNTPFTPSSTATYTVTGIDANGCQNTDQITVNVNPIPTSSFNVDINDGCIPLTVNFTNTNNGNASWDFGDGSTSNQSGNISHTYNSTGCFDVSLTVTDNAGCSSTTTMSDYICTSGPPVASFSQSDVLVPNSNPVVYFYNSSIGANAYEWHFGDGNTSVETDPDHTYPDQPETYRVMLVAYAGNCTDTAYSAVEVEEELLFYVPNTFTPDGDPHNQIFKPVMTSGFDPYNYTLYIFNRWGEILFESHNTDIGWDGTYQGKLVQDGTYVWKIIIHDTKTDERKDFHGHVNVLK